MRVEIYHVHPSQLLDHKQIAPNKCESPFYFFAALFPEPCTDIFVRTPGNAFMVLRCFIFNKCINGSLGIDKAGFSPGAFKVPLGYLIVRRLPDISLDQNQPHQRENYTQAKARPDQHIIEALILSLQKPSQVSHQKRENLA
jgi:hypothetical protein